MKNEESKKLNFASKNETVWKMMICRYRPKHFIWHNRARSSTKKKNSYKLSKEDSRKKLNKWSTMRCKCKKSNINKSKKPTFKIWKKWNVSANFKSRLKEKNKDKLKNNYCYNKKCRMLSAKTKKFGIAKRKRFLNVKWRMRSNVKRPKEELTKKTKKTVSKRL